MYRSNVESHLIFKLADFCNDVSLLSIEWREYNRNRMHNHFFPFVDSLTFLFKKTNFTLQ